MIAFLDANALIYLLEGEQPFVGRVRAAPGDLTQTHPEIGTCVSRLTWLECRVGPMRSGNRALLTVYG